MFARVTQYQMKPESKESARDLLNSLKDEIMSMPGVHNFVNVMNDEGRGFVVSIVESEEISNANAPKVAEIWSKFADHLAEPPTPAGFDVMANWSK